MKILFATAALATLVSSSAHAQYGNWRGDYRAYAQVPPYAAYRSNRFNRGYAQVPPYAASRAYAQVPPYAASRAYARVPPYAASRAYAQTPSATGYDVYGYRSPYPYSVYDIRGAYVGSDPDARVRNQLARDPSQGD